jgi:CheY-like chemotaxis protein
MRILIAEDSVTMRKVMQMTFAGENVELLAVDNGELAIQRGREFRPDVVFVDASLPGTDGYEVTRAIRNDPHLSNVPVILMASQQRAYDSGRGTEVGVNDHIVKPFDSQEAIDKAHRAVDRLPVADVASPNARTNIPPIAATRVPEPTRHRPPPPLPVQPVMAGGGSTVSSRPAPQASPTLSSAAPPFSSMPRASAPAPGRAAPTAGLGSNGNLAAERLAALGLTPDQVDGVLKISAEVVERVVWEVVPQLAEAMIREELRRLTGE